MRHTILSRSAIAVASIAVGSAAFAAVPANAASSSDVTRAQVLTAANATRTDPNSYEEYLAAQRAVRPLATRACNVDTDGGEFLSYSNGRSVQPSAGVDGIVISAYITNNDADTSRYCNVAALATPSESTKLAGTATLTGTDPYSSGADATKVYGSSTLSGDVFVTPIVDVPDYGRVQLDASGTANTTTITSTTTKVKDVKTKAEKKKAKKTYANRLKAAKKAYTKALRKADRKSEKAAAKRAYSVKRSSAKAKYKVAVANYKLVTRIKPVVSVAVFTVTASTYNAND